MYVLSEKNRLKKVEEGFPVSHLDVERLMAEWRWRCPEKMGLIARNAFGDLFLRNESGEVYWLDAGGGKFSRGSRTPKLNFDPPQQTSHFGSFGLRKLMKKPPRFAD